jgi:hypothetical protein
MIIEEILISLSDSRIINQMTLVINHQLRFQDSIHLGAGISDGDQCHQKNSGLPNLMRGWVQVI